LTVQLRLSVLNPDSNVRIVKNLKIKRDEIWFAVNDERYRGGK